MAPIYLKKRLWSLIPGLLMFLFPTLVFSLFALTGLDYQSELVIGNILENFCFALLVIVLIYCLPAGRYQYPLLYLGYFIVALKVFLHSSYLHLYPYNISASTIFIILETNYNEILEYLKFNLGLFNIFLFLVLSIPLWVFIIFRKTGKYKPEESRKKVYFPVFLIFLILAFYIKQNLQESNLYFIALHSYTKYKNQLAVYDELGLHETNGKFEEVSRKKDTTRQIFVLVIGESTTRHHLGLYGYPRKTTPYLSKLQESLFVYTDVISPHTHTIPSLSKILTLKNYENEDLLRKGSLIQLMNKAGFTTFWISNQRPIGIDENMVTKIAQASSEIYFMNSRIFYLQSLYDEVLLSPLEKVLNNEGDLFIVLHLLGTHIDYKNRYPDKFAFFEGPAPEAVSEEGISAINDYDNAVLYNDYVLNEIIKKVRKRRASSWVLYLSDHGEDVFRVNNSASHTEAAGTYPMYDVPFILWTSPRYRLPENLIIRKDRKYMLDDLIYSIADLSEIDFKLFEPERSIFNRSFKERPRQVYNKKDYDSIYKEKP